MKKKTARTSQTLVEWNAEHLRHGVHLVPCPYIEWHWHVCECGALLLTITPERLAAETARSLKAKR